MLEPAELALDRRTAAVKLLEPRRHDVAEQRHSEAADGHISGTGARSRGAGVPSVLAPQAIRRA